MSILETPRLLLRPLTLADVPAVTAVQDYLFFEMKVDHIHVANHIKNQGSKRIKEKAGAKWLRPIEIERRNGEDTAVPWEVTAERRAA